MRRERNFGAGLVAGAIGGYAASWIMNQFQAWMMDKMSDPRPDDASKNPQQKKQARAKATDEPATAKVAEAVSQKVLKRGLTAEEREKAEPIVHYAFGASVGAMYGLLTEVSPVFSAGSGAGYGFAVWLGADEAALPALGLTKSPKEYPPSLHGSMLATHVVYGLALHGITRIIRAIL